MSFPRQTWPGPHVSALLSTSGRPQQLCCEAGRTERARCTCARGSQSLQDPLWCCWAALHKRCSREAWLLVMMEG